MAGGVAPTDFDLWSVFRAARDSAQRKRMDEAQLAQQQQQFDWQKEDRAYQDKQRAAAAENAAQMPGLIEGARTGDPTALAHLYAANPDLAAKLESGQQSQRSADIAAAPDRARIQANVEKMIASASPEQLPAALEQARRLTASGVIDRFEVPGPMTSPDGMQRVQAQVAPAEALATALQKPVERKTTGDMLEAASALHYGGDIAAAEKDPRWSATLAKVSSSKATQINTGDLPTRTAGQFASADAQAEIVKGAIAEISRLTNGNPDLYGKMSNKGIAWGTDALKAFGMDPGATAEDISQRQEEIKKNLDFIKANSVFHNDNGQVEADLSSTLTEGNNLKAGLSALTRHLDNIQSVHARRSKPGQAIGPGATPPPAVHPSQAAQFAARLDADFKAGRIDQATYAAKKAELAGGQ